MNKIIKYGFSMVLLLIPKISNSGDMSLKTNYTLRKIEGSNWHGMGLGIKTYEENFSYEFSLNNLYKYGEKLYEGGVNFGIGILDKNFNLELMTGLFRVVKFSEEYMLAPKIGVEMIYKSDLIPVDLSLTPTKQWYIGNKDKNVFSLDIGIVF